jgi:galactokinase
VVTVDINQVKPGLKGEWERYALGVLWSLGVKDGVDLMIDGHVPLGAGLSSSAALECSVATAMNHLFDLGFNLEELARLTQKAENQYRGSSMRNHGSIRFINGDTRISVTSRLPGSFY